MDLLTDILHSLRLRGNLYFRTDLSKPWGIYVPPDGKVARFHLVIKGECWVAIADDDDSFLISEGDLVIIPHGNSHRLMDAPKRDCRPLQEVLAEQKLTDEGILRYGGGGSTTTLVCGFFGFDDEVMHPLIETLPRKIHMKGSDNGNFIWLETVMKFIGSEAEGNHLGSRATMERLAEILFIQVIRAYAKIAPENIGYLAAINDKNLCNVLKQIHTKPENKWTLEELSHEAGLSRSALAEKFKTTMGLPPMEYLTRWRMMLAKTALRESKHSIVEIAEKVGYQSDASFSTAFKKYFGHSPGHFRHIDS